MEIGRRFDELEREPKWRHRSRRELEDRTLLQNGIALCAENFGHSLSIRFLEVSCHANMDRKTMLPW